MPPEVRSSRHSSPFRYFISSLLRCSLSAEVPVTTKRSDSSNPDFCQFPFADGRRCRMLRHKDHPSLCLFHARDEQPIPRIPATWRRARRLPQRRLLHRHRHQPRSWKGLHRPRPRPYPRTQGRLRRLSRPAPAPIHPRRQKSVTRPGKRWSTKSPTSPVPPPPSRPTRRKTPRTNDPHASRSSLLPAPAPSDSM
jgi:hypothetical protein